MRYALLIALLFTTGCARYEYQLQEPVQRHIGKKPHVFLDKPPVTYEFVTYDNSLVVWIENTGDETLTLRPDKSYVIDKKGASRAIRGAAIAPGSYVKLIFPPPRPYVRDDGPHFGVGFGAYDGGGGIGTGVGVGRSYGNASVGNLDENYYWEWEREGRAKFHLVYTDGKQDIVHDLVIDRVRQ